MQLVELIAKQRQKRTLYFYPGGRAMRFISKAASVTTAAAFTMLALSGGAFASQAAPAPKPAAKTAAKTTKAAKATVITATGTVGKFDAASNTLTVTTAKGDVAFMVDGSSNITANGAKVSASDLANQVGHKVTIRYTEEGGQKMAHSVKVSAAPKAASSAKKASTKKSS